MTAILVRVENALSMEWGARVRKALEACAKEVLTGTDQRDIIVCVGDYASRGANHVVVTVTALNGRTRRYTPVLLGELGKALHGCLAPHMPKGWKTTVVVSRQWPQAVISSSS